MSTRHCAVTLLVRLYPAAWRKEYGAELLDILMACPLTMHVVVDVARSVLRQRFRAAEPSTILGLASMLVILSGFVLTHGRYDHSATALLQPYSRMLPTVSVTWLPAEFYALLLVGCGSWTQLGHGATLKQSGVAAMRMSLIGGLPIMLGGLLIAFGILDVRFVGPATAQHQAPLPSAMIVTPLLRLPESWIWGAVGGQLGRWISRQGQTADEWRQRHEQRGSHVGLRAAP